MSDVHDIMMPKLGLTMTEGTLAEWRVKRGDRVAAGDVLFVVETDKIANEIEAPAPGEIREIVVPAGSAVPVGAIVARWTGPGLRIEPETTNDAKPAPAVAPPAKSAPRTDGRVVATPLARRLGHELGIDLSGITGSGPRGRIKAADVEAARDRRLARSSTPDAGAFEPASSVQAAIAKRLSLAKQEIPHFYVAREAEVSALLALREQLNTGAGPKLSVTHVIVAAAGRALVDTPDANRVWRDGGYARFGRTDIGVAVQTPRGLFAPVLRDAGRMTLDEVAAAATALFERSRAGALTQDDLTGGALSVSNVGMHDVTYLTPIVNPGQAAILGVGSVREVFRPDANGAPVLKRETGLVLAADHRVFDGVGAAAFLNRIVHYLEHPALLMRAPR